MNMKKILPLFLFLVFASFWACNSKIEVNTSNQVKQGLGLVKVDSIVVDFMEGIRLLDYDPERELILGYNRRTGDYIEFNLNGEIVHQVNRTGEGPNGHGRNTLQVNYMGNGKVGVAAIGRYYIYDEDWQVERKIDFEFLGSYVLNNSSFYFLGNPQGKKTDHPYLTIVDIGLGFEKEEDLKKPHFTHLNTETGAMNKYHQLPDSSVYVQTDVLYDQLLAPKVSYNYEQQVLDVVHTLEPVIYRYNLRQAIPELISVTPFEYDNPHALKGIPFDQYSPFSRSPVSTISLNQIILAAHSFEDKHLIVYRERHPRADVMNKNETDMEKIKEYLSITPDRWAYVVENGVRITKDFAYPSPGIALQIGKGRFLSSRYVDEEVERETQLFYIYELQLE